MADYKEADVFQSVIDNVYFKRYGVWAKAVP